MTNEIGFDLEGNTFWEFKNYNVPGRMRRLVELRRSIPYVDYKMPRKYFMRTVTIPDKTLRLESYHFIIAQWNQWLRSVRDHPPTLNELMAEEYRLATLGERIKAADARWRSIPLKEKPVSHLHKMLEDSTTLEKGIEDTNNGASKSTEKPIVMQEDSAVQPTKKDIHGSCRK